VSPPANGFRLAIVGVGRMGRTHLEALKASSKVVVTAAVDPRPEVREELSAGAVRCYSSADELLEKETVDGALVAVPTGQHRALVEQLALAGLPVLCEKPCGLSSDQARECVTVTERAGIPFQVAYWRRYVPELRSLRGRVMAGELGELLAVHCGQWDAAPPAPAFRGGSGGIFVDMGVHEFDQVRWLTGREFETVKAVTSGPPAADPETGDVDCGHAAATLTGGATAVVSLGRWHPAGDTCRVDVYGTKETVSSCFLPPSGGDAVFHEALRLQAEDFARMVSDGGRTGAMARDAVVALEVAERAKAEAGDRG
jgi:myo-inositol 2-dehydrogenase / D-chiro-inositol 1-dehydrogenase